MVSSLGKLLNYAQCRIRVSKLLFKNCVQANDDNLKVLPYIIVFLSPRRPESYRDSRPLWGLEFLDQKKGLYISTNKMLLILENFKKMIQNMIYKNTWVADSLQEIVAMLFNLSELRATSLLLEMSFLKR